MSFWHPCSIDIKKNDKDGIDLDLDDISSDEFDIPKAYDDFHHQ